jgi:hypothetical protein
MATSSYIIDSPVVFRGLDNALAAVTGSEKSRRIGSETLGISRRDKKGKEKI